MDDFYEDETPEESTARKDALYKLIFDPGDGSIDFSSAPVLYWSKAIVRIDQRRRQLAGLHSFVEDEDIWRELKRLSDLETMAHTFLSEEIARQEHE